MFELSVDELEASTGGSTEGANTVLAAIVIGAAIGVVAAPAIGAIAAAGAIGGAASAGIHALLIWNAVH